MELWSWVLSLLGLVGIWLTGSKHRAGWVILLVDEVLWIVYGALTHQSGFVFVGVLWAVVYARNLWRWSRSPHHA